VDADANDAEAEADADAIDCDACCSQTTDGCCSIATQGVGSGMTEPTFSLPPLCTAISASLTSERPIDPTTWWPATKGSLPRMTEVTVHSESCPEKKALISAAAAEEKDKNRKISQRSSIQLPHRNRLRAQSSDTITPVINKSSRRLRVKGNPWSNRRITGDGSRQLRTVAQQRAA
jgi:hypothetical protein